jgi:hypothetical protein
MKEKYAATRTEKEPTPKYKEKILYEHRASEASKCPP